MPINLNTKLDICAEAMRYGARCLKEPFTEDTDDAAEAVDNALDVLGEARVTITVMAAALQTLMKAEPMQAGERNGYIMGVISQAIDAARIALAHAGGGAPSPDTIAALNAGKMLNALKAARVYLGDAATDDSPEAAAVRVDVDAAIAKAEGK